MKKTIIALVALFACSFKSFSQEDDGFSTTDIGAEFNHYSGGNICNLHLAFNAKVHSAIILRVGYNMVNENYSDSYQGEKGGGITGGIGYRYYFDIKPHGFFVGARAEVWNLNIDWTKNLSSGKTKTTFFTPAFETGYMLIHRDWFIFTPSVSLGTRINIKSDVSPLNDGLVVFYGFSAGFKIFNLRE